MRLSGLLLLHIFTLTKLCAQVPKADFSTSKASYCQGEAVILENKSTLADSYEWDFCDQDFQGDTETSFLSSIPGAGRILGIDFVKYHETWYAFATSWNNNKIFRLTFANGVENSPTEVVDLGNPGNVLNGSVSVYVVQDAANWYVLVHSWNAATISKINFGTDLLNDAPTGATYVNGVGGFPAKMDVVKTKDHIYASVIQQNGSITLVDLSAGLDKPVTASNIFKTSAITGVSSARDIELIFDHNKWYAFIASFTNGKVFRADFGENLMDGFASTPIEVASSFSTGRVQNIEVTKSGYGYYLHALTFEGELYKVALDSVKDLPMVEEFVKYGETSTYKEGYVLTFLKDFGSWYGFTFQDNAGANPKLYSIRSKKLCPVSIQSSTHENPTVYYTKPGQYAVTLTAYDESGNRDDTTQFITVTENQAPVLDIQLSSLCSGNSSTITAISNQLLISSNWIINGEAMSGDTVHYTFPSPGTYTITLEVQSTNGCSNRITKDITIYDPPVPGFTSPVGTICTNGEVAFTNQTNTQGADDLVSYHWDFNGEGSGTEANPTYVFSSGGAKTVTLTASIPGCSESFSQTINVEQGPVVGFEVPYVCEGREVQFANTTTGTGITAYNWDFGDGGTYTSATATDPFYTYQTSGTYTVTLTVGNALGCNNVFSRQVAVYTQPVADFLAEVACVGIPMQLTDQSTSGTTSNIIQWRWDFGDGKGVANVRNPVYTYQQPGTYQVRLEVTSSAGCIGEVVKEITVATPVTADFTYTLQCHAENNNAYTLQLQDASVASTGNRITQWLWTVNGESFTTPQVNYTFDGPGTYDITLTATAASACSDAITKTVEIFTPPAVAFTYEPACASEAVVFTNTTSDGSDADAINPIADSVTRYTWDFGGVGTSFEVNPQFAFNKAGTYPVSLTVHTKDGCAYRQVQQVEVPAQPQAKFRPSTTRGAYPLTVQFDNQSIQYSQHIWVINGDTLKEQNPDYTFTAAGQYEAWLTVANELGCSHTTSQQIIVVEPVWNVVLENVLVTVSEDGGSYQLVLTVRNAGTLVVEGFPVNVRVDQLIALNEHFGGQIAPGERLNYVVPFTLSANLNAQVSFLCVTLQDKPGAPPDVSANDNRMCINLKDAYSSLAPYPNPVKGQMYLSLILNEAAAVDIQVEDSRGSQVKGQHYTETRKGLNIFNVDMSTLANGLYLIHMRFAGHAKTYRVVVQH